jgi:hypothetical protein
MPPGHEYYQHSAGDLLCSPSSRAYAMVMPAQHQTEWTAERALAFPWDGKRREVLDGELFVTPAPSWDHQSLLETPQPS